MKNERLFKGMKTGVEKECKERPFCFVFFFHESVTDQINERQERARRARS